MVNENKILLKVSEALQDDAYKGIARLDFSLMNQIGVTRGDAINIKGSKLTVAIADRAYPADMGEGIIRIDGLMRKNAGVSLGDEVEVTKAEVKEAKKIVIAPAQKGVMVQGDSESLRRGLLGRILSKSDLVVLGGVQRRKDLMSQDLGDLGEIFGNLGEMFGGMGNLGGGITQLRFVVVSTNPNTSVIITENTEVILNSKSVDVIEDKIPTINYEDIGGLTEEIKKIREMVEIPMKHPEIFQKLGVSPPKGVLLHGPPGTGKTLLAKAVATETDSHFILLNGPEIMSKFYGESEKKIRTIFEDAEKNSPSIVFIDEIDAIAPKREDVNGEVERRVVSQLLTMMDGLNARGKVIVIGATNRVDSLDPALRRPGRFDRELEIGVPSKEGRLQVLKIHSRGMPIEPLADKKYLQIELDEINSNNNLIELDLKKKKSENEIKELNDKLKENKEIIKIIEKSIEKFSEDSSKNHNLLLSFARKDKDIIIKILMKQMMNKIASLTHGFVGADLEALTKEAAMNVLRNNLDKIKIDEDNIHPEVLEKLIIVQDDFLNALKVVRPSAMREVLVETPTIGWDGVGGLDRIKQDLQEAVEWPMKYPDSFKRMGIRPSRGILLYGPPGTGKTLLAKAVAKESEANFISVKGPSLLSMWVGKSEEGVRKIFEKARQVSPCIIFFDEIDSIGGRRGSDQNKVTERVLNQILSEMDGLDDMKDVLVIAATNRPDMLDTALLRPGRFDKILLVNAPTEEGREHIFKIHTKNMPLAEDVDLSKLAKELDGFTGADIEALSREAAMIALRENMEAKEVKKRHFDEAMNKVKPSVTKQSIETYKKVESQFLNNAKSAITQGGATYFG
jgi:transitional endoplasmic reticulum ATPase